MPLVGTAGHVDHGKSTLIQALTGRDPDRWSEEKRRGLTIDLGFAWADLGDGNEVSFVDVPGHERYLKNMLAGVDPIDAALLVVAADEGWMPQSEEHLAVLELLGITSGVVALTKIDLVDEDIVELATLEIGEKIDGTGLEDAPIVPVSASTGKGLGAVKSALLQALPPAAPLGGDRPRMWVDRSFSVAGTGTVVTGTLVDGSLSVGDTVEITPGGLQARVRTMQSHERGLEGADPGRRLALGLSGVDRKDVPRGSMIGLPGQWDISSRFTARLRLARYVGELTAKGAYHLHLGTGAHRLTVQRIEGAHALMALPAPLPMKCGDRFIVRDTGRKLVVAGGQILDPDPGTAKRALHQAQSIDPTADSSQIASVLLSIRGADTVQRLTAHSGGGTPPGAMLVGDRMISPENYELISNRVRDMVAEDHERHPLRPGLPLATLAASLDQPAILIEEIVGRHADLERHGPDVRISGRTVQLSSQQSEAWEQAEQRLGRGLDVPRSDELGVDPEVIHLKLREGRVVRLSDDFVLLTEQISVLVQLIKDMPEGFSIAQFRDATGLSRKYAVPMLEWSDRVGLTTRRGDLRYHI